MAHILFRARLLALVALLGVSQQAAARLKVVATVSDLGAIAREVGGDRVQVEVLAKSTQDPHFVDARPNLVLLLSRANLLLHTGVDLEAGWLPVLVTSSRNPSIQPGASGNLDCSTLVELKEIPREKLDRSMGDIHPGGNPHYTKDPRNAALVARGIAERLAKLEPEGAALFRESAARFEQKLAVKIEEWQKALAPFKGTPVVTYHKSWVYFAEWAGLEQVAFVEPKPGLPPSTGHVAAVLGVMKERKAPLILQEEWYSAATSELLAKSSGARLVRVSGMTPEGKSYLEHADSVVRELLEALASRDGG